MDFKIRLDQRKEDWERRGKREELETALDVLSYRRQKAEQQPAGQGRITLNLQQEDRARRETLESLADDLETLALLHGHQTTRKADASLTQP